MLNYNNNIYIYIIIKADTEYIVRLDNNDLRPGKKNHRKSNYNNLRTHTHTHTLEYIIL